MSCNSVLIDSLTRIRNAQRAKFHRVKLKFSKLVVNVLKILCDLDYIDSFEVLRIERDGSAYDAFILVSLRYYNSAPLISKMKVFSKPGNRVYVQSGNLPTFFDGMGVVIVSTSKGLMIASDAAKANIGGEVLFGVF